MFSYVWSGTVAHVVHPYQHSIYETGKDRSKQRTIRWKLADIHRNRIVLRCLLLIDLVLRLNELLHEAARLTRLLAPFLCDFAVPLEALVGERPDVPVEAFVEGVCAGCRGRKQSMSYEF